MEGNRKEDSQAISKQIEKTWQEVGAWDPVHLSKWNQETEQLVYISLSQRETWEGLVEKEETQAVWLPVIKPSITPCWVQAKSKICFQLVEYGKDDGMSLPYLCYTILDSSLANQSKIVCWTWRSK